MSVASASFPEQRCRLIVQRLLPVLLLALLVVISPVPAAAAPSDVARFLFPKTVLLTMSDSHGRPLSIGSGLILRPGLVVTNFHVIEGSGSGVAKRIGDNTKYNVLGVVAKDAFRDLAILQINGLVAEGAELSQRAMIDIGETVFAVGNPRGLEGTFSAGIVSAHRNIKGLDLLQITAPISPGSSGGPIADERGEVVGLAVATFTGGQNLNFAIPARYIKELSNSIGALVPLSKTATASTSQRFYQSIQGEQLRDGVSASSFLWYGSRPRETLGGYGTFSLSVTNKLKEPIRDPVIMILFHDPSGRAIDYSVLRPKGILPAGIAKRITGEVDPSTKRITTPISPSNEFMYDDRPATKLEFRTLGFTMDAD
jgi:S1-C subfamily serine protease